MLADFVEGHEYADDLLRLRAGGEALALDVERANALCDYLVGIHRVPGTDPGLYVRRVRELLGHGECIFGVVDSYPAKGPVPEATLREVERRCLAWRWTLKPRSAPPAPGARRFPSVEHPVSRGRRLQRARPLARRVGRRGRRRHLPHAQLPLLLAAALREARGRLRAPVPRLLGALPRALGRHRAARGGRAVLRLPRPRDGAARSGTRRSAKTSAPSCCASS